MGPDRHRRPRRGGGPSHRGGRAPPSSGGGPAGGRPLRSGGRVYDLALNHTDRLGQMWLYDGLRQADDTPLLTLDGTSGPPYPLTSIVEANGPLTPVAANPGRHETG
ncbi:BN159_2729 family protein [Streptomyces sp. DHE7-1]|nr:BN159_2729 family protein [Streptomyces sp. DHE7-1]